MTEENINNTANAPTFGMQDLLFTLHVYEICTQRGSFKAEELSTVGAVYDRLKEFLIKNEIISLGNSDDVESSTISTT